MDETAAVAALAALAQASRLAVFRLLVQQGPAGLAAGAIGERVGIPATTLSFHLAQLGHAGLVVSRRHGRSIVYAAHYAAMQDLLGFLLDNCCQAGGGCNPAPASPSRRPRRRGPSKGTVRKEER